MFRERGWERVAPGSCRSACRDIASGAIATLLGIRGHNLAPVSACSTGAHAVSEAAELVRRGDADVVLAGGGEACIHPLIYAGFATMRASARRGRRGPGGRVAPVRRHARRLRLRGGRDDPRGGVGRARRAPRRPHPRRGRLAAAARTTPTTPPRRTPTRWASSTMMRLALERAGLAPAASATSTRTAPPRRRAIPPRRRPSARSSAPRRPPGVSSTKSATGHQFGGAGSFEVAVCALALRDRRATHAQLPRPRPRVRPRLRARGRAQGRARVRALELDGPRRPQRLRRAAPLPRLEATL